MKTTSIRRAGAVSLAFVLSLTLTVPIFAARDDDRDRRDVRERIVRIIKKLFGVGTNDDSVTPPRP